MRDFSEEQNIFANRQQKDKVFTPYEMRAIIKRIVNKVLKGQIRTVYYLSEYYNYSREEVSEIMGLPVSTIKKYKQRANKIVKSVIEGDN